MPTDVVEAEEVIKEAATVAVGAKYDIVREAAIEIMSVLCTNGVLFCGQSIPDSDIYISNTPSSWRLLT